MIGIHRRRHPPVIADPRASQHMEARPASRPQGPTDSAERATGAPTERRMRAELDPMKDKPAPRGSIDRAPPRPPRSEAAEAAEHQRFLRVKEMVQEHPRYLALDEKSRAVADEILDVAETKDNPLYYAEKLKLLFDTPEAAEEVVAESNHDDVAASVEASEERLATPEGKKNLKLEEKKSADPSRKWERLKGKNGSFDIDRSNPSDVVVKMRVHLTGDKADVDATKSLEDDIEKAASTTGYTVDVEFVKRSGPGVFDAKVDPEGWTTAANWVGASDDIAHEAHHRLGLDDRYDYIESHADNEEMMIPTRLHWFRVQIDKPFDPNGKHSLMGSGDTMLHDDVCGVAQLGDDCVDQRTKELGGI